MTQGPKETWNISSVGIKIMYLYVPHISVVPVFYCGSLRTSYGQSVLGPGTTRYEEGKLMACHGTDRIRIVYLQAFVTRSSKVSTW